jgi:WD40 repeat protein
LSLAKKILLFFLVSITLACEPTSSIDQAIFSHQYGERPLMDAHLSEDASQAITLSIDGVLSIWDNQTHSIIREWHSFDIKENLYLAVLSRNKQLAAVAGKTQISILDVGSGKTLISWRPQGFDKDASITVIALGNSEKNVWLGLSDGTIISVDLKSNKQSMFAHHKGPIADIRLTEDQQHILSSSTDGSVVYWNASDGKILNEREQNYRITSLSIHEASRKVFVSDALKTQIIWDLANEKIVSKLDYFRGARTFRESLFVDNGRKLITASSKQILSLWDVRTGIEISSWNISSSTSSTNVVAMANGHNGQLYTLSSDAILEIWNINISLAK